MIENILVAQPYILKKNKKLFQEETFALLNKKLKILFTLWFEIFF